MAPQENPRNLHRGFPLNTYLQRIEELTMDQLKGLDPKEQERLKRSANIFKETHLIASTIEHSIGDSERQIDSIDDFRKYASLSMIHASCGLFAQRVFDRLPERGQKVLNTLLNINTEFREYIANVSSIRVGDVSIQDLIQERSDNSQTQTTRPIGSYFTLLVDLARTINDPAVLENVIQQNQHKKLNPDELRHTVLSSATLAGAMLLLYDLDRSILVGKDKRISETIEKEAGRLLHTTARLQGEIFTTLSHPESPNFPSVRDSLQPYLLSQDLNTKNLCVSALTREDMGHLLVLYRTAQQFIDRGEETEFYQSVVDTIEEVAQYRNQRSDKISVITKEHVAVLLDSQQEIPPQEAPALEEISEFSKNLSLPRSKEPFHVEPPLVQQSGLSVPTNITVDSRQYNNLLISFWYTSEDGKPIEFAVQFPVGKKNPDPREFRWNALADPSKEPQLYAAVMRATKAVINNSKEQIEKRKIRQETSITPTQTPPKISVQRQESKRHSPPKKGQDKHTPISKDQVTVTREIGRSLRRLSDDEQNKIQETIQTYNTSGGNIRKLQLLGVRGGPYYGLDAVGGKIIVMQRVGKSSNLEVVAVGTLQEVIKSLTK